MDLLIDCGNSRIKWAEYSGIDDPGDLSVGEPIDRDDENFSDQLTTLLQVADSASRVVISDVAKSANVNIIEQLKLRRPDLDVMLIGAREHGYGIRNCYSDPQTLGADRWAALIGARHSRTGDLIVLDCGTAITVDAIRLDGEFIGGMILPSAWLAEQALSDGTALIDRDSFTARTTESARNSNLGQSTTTCVQAGASVAALGGVKLAVEMAAEELTQDCLMIVTGGDALLYLDATTITALHDPDLVLRGLAVIAGHTDRASTS